MSENATQSSHAGWARLVGAGVVTVVVAVVGNLVVRALLFALFEMPADFEPFQPVRVTFLTVLGVAAATVAFAVIARRSGRPVRTFRRVAAVAFVLSIVPNLALAANPEAAPFDNASAAGFLILIVFHVVAAVISVILLPRLALT